MSKVKYDEEKYDKEIELKAVRFYDEVQKEFYKLAYSRDLSKPEIEMYFKPTDALIIKKLCLKNDINFDELYANEKNYLFAKVCFHAQNTNRGAGGVVNFDKNFKLMYVFFQGFVPAEFQNYFKDTDKNLIPAVLTAWLERKNQFKELDIKNLKDKLGDLKEEFKDKIKNFDPITAAKWNEESKKRTNIYLLKTSLKSYCEGMYMASNEICKLGESPINELINKIGTENQIKNLKDIFKKGFGDALACDFIKELSEDFNNLAKPDYHVKKIINRFLNLNEKQDEFDFDDEFDDARDYVHILQKIVEKINKENPLEKLSVYKLDRMLYTIGSKDFFLNDIDVYDDFIDSIEKINKNVTI